MTTTERAQAPTAPRLYVKVLPVTEVKPGDVIRYRSRALKPRTLSMTVVRTIDCGQPEDGSEAVILLMGNGRKLDGTDMATWHGAPIRRVATFRSSQRVDVLRPLTEAEDAKIHEGLVKA